MVKKQKQEKSKNTQLEKILIENFVALQKVMVNLSIKLDELTNKISKLLELFETSAKTLSEKDFSYTKGNEDSKKVIEKIDSLINQNKTIARGLALMYEGRTPPANIPISTNSKSSLPQSRFRPVPKE